MRFGRDEHGATIDGGLLLRSGHHSDDRYDSYHGGHGLSHIGFPAGHYYSHYSPFYSPSYYSTYDPYRSYSYFSPYYSSRYAYSNYGADLYDSCDYPVYADNTPTPRPRNERQLVGPPPADPSLTDSGEDTFIGEGNAAFASGNYDDARRWYVQAMLTDERDGHAKLLYAVANFAARDYIVAATALRRALLTTPALLEFPVDLRRLYVRESQWEQQLAHLENHVAANAADSNVLFLLAFLHYSSGDLASAAIVNHTAGTIDPDNTLVGLLADAIARVTPAKQ